MLSLMLHLRRLLLSQFHWLAVGWKKMSQQKFHCGQWERSGAAVAQSSGSTNFTSPFGSKFYHRSLWEKLPWLRYSFQYRLWFQLRELVLQLSVALSLVPTLLLVAAEIAIAISIIALLGIQLAFKWQVHIQGGYGWFCLRVQHLISLLETTGDETRERHPKNALSDIGYYQSFLTQLLSSFSPFSGSRHSKFMRRRKLLAASCA